MTLHECVSAAVSRLIDSGFAPDDARRDTGVLARFALGWSLADWAARARETAPPGFEERLGALVARRAVREPVSYITGSREFFGRPFLVTPATLIPRPETEGLVEEALRANSARRVESIIDVGTGSGCIAVTLALELPHARVIATDVSEATLDVARTNAAALNAAVEFHRTDTDSFVPPGLPPVAVVVSNPPYVPERDRDALAADVRNYEPAGALFAGPDGMSVIRRLVPAAARALAPGGLLLMEIGAGQADAVAEVVRDAGLELAAIKPDLQGIPRVVVARRGA